MTEQTERRRGFAVMVAENNCVILEYGTHTKYRVTTEPFFDFKSVTFIPDGDHATEVELEQ